VARRQKATRGSRPDKETTWPQKPRGTLRQSGVLSPRKDCIWGWRCSKLLLNDRKYAFWLVGPGALGVSMFVGVGDGWPERGSLDLTYRANSCRLD
jgi:hypothetical protein